MDAERLITRRVAIKDMGKAGMALMVFGAACTEESSPATTITTPGTTTTAALTTTTESGSTTQPGETTTAPIGAGTEWARVNLGFVSAYILYRNGEAALVDTGTSGAEGSIEAALGTIGLGWDAVTSVIVTHRHGDHAGSVDAVAALAVNSNVYGGAGDLSALGQFDSQGPVAVGDNDSVFGLDIIETPGHTPGHLCVLDAAAGILVVGDAMNRNGGTLNSASADPQFTDDLAQADESVRKLAGFEFEALLVGHGEPIESGGKAEVEALAASLG